MRGHPDHVPEPSDKIVYAYVEVEDKTYRFELCHDWYENGDACFNWAACSVMKPPYNEYTRVGTDEAAHVFNEHYDEIEPQSEDLWI